MIIASAAGWLVSRSITSAGEAPALERASRLLLVGIGLWRVLRAVWRLPRVHGEGLAVGVMAGLVPCPLTLFLTFYATSKGVPEAGLTFAAAMLVGVGSVLIVVAVLSAFARRFTVVFSAGHGLPTARIAQAIEVLAGLIVISVATLDLLGWQRPARPSVVAASTDRSPLLRGSVRPRNIRPSCGPSPGRQGRR